MKCEILIGIILMMEIWFVKNFPRQTFALYGSCLYVKVFVHLGLKEIIALIVCSTLKTFLVLPILKIPCIILNKLSEQCSSSVHKINTLLESSILLMESYESARPVCISNTDQLASYSFFVTHYIQQWTVDSDIQLKLIPSYM